MRPAFESGKHGINGWFFPHEGVWYRRMAGGIMNGNILEIGRFQGLSISYIFNICKRNANVIHSVDHKLEPEFVRLMKKMKNDGTVDVIVEDSVKAADLFPNDFFDFVFIDGNHTYTQVKADIIAYLPKIKHGACMSGHDYSQYWPGVIKAVDEIFPHAIKRKRIWLQQIDKGF